MRFIKDTRLISAEDIGRLKNLIMFLKKTIRYTGSKINFCFPYARIPDAKKEMEDGRSCYIKKLFTKVYILVIDRLLKDKLPLSRRQN